MSTETKNNLVQLGPAITLMLSALAAIILANSNLFQNDYAQLLNLHVFSHFTLAHLINDGLMCLFFLFVAIEIKREISTASKDALLLPAIAACGGVLVPAALYFLFTYSNTEASTGWAIPAATDIAFSLAILSLLGKRVPLVLKLFLTTIAVADDLLAIGIIALFYTNQLSILYLTAAGLLTTILIYLGKKRVSNNYAYLILGAALWFCTLESGLHATLAGVTLGFCLPLYGRDKKIIAKKWEHALTPWVNYGVLPLFALANCGIPLSGLTLDSITQNVSLGVMSGLVLGKPIGLFGFALLAIKLKLVKIPEGLNLNLIFGAALLGGIGFTMSLFVSNLAFTSADQTLLNLSRCGIIIGSFISALLGYLFLHRTLHTKVQCKPKRNIEFALFV